MTPEVADVNWLLSAIAQASAALVAIVAGLLVSRYVSLHAEQQAASRRVLDLTRRLTLARSARDSAQQSLDQFDVDEALADDDVYIAIAKSHYSSSVMDILKVIGRSVEEFAQPTLKDSIERLTQEVQTALDTLKPMVPVNQEHPRWDGFRRTHTLPIENRQVWEWAYEIICEIRTREARQQARREAGKFGSLLGVSTVQRMPVLGGAIPSRLFTGSGGERRRLLDARDSTSARVHELENELILAQENYDATRHPEGFGLALQTLSVLAVLGIAFPVTLLALVTYELHPIARTVSVAAFFIGVGLLLRFLFVYADFLREDGRSHLPTSIFGLFRAR